jgi:hypothetical protein
MQRRSLLISTQRMQVYRVAFAFLQRSPFKATHLLKPKQYSDSQFGAIYFMGAKFCASTNEPITKSYNCYSLGVSGTTDVKFLVS